MTTADELLNKLTMTNSEDEGYIEIGTDRHITVPKALQRIAVEGDHNIETVTFKCPRYWDEHDLSQMILYINYRLPDGEIGSYIVKNIKVIDDDNFTFTWTIRREVTKYKGNISFLVCAKSTELEGDEPLEKLHWNTELCTDAYVSEGLEAEPIVEEDYPDILTQLLERMTVVEAAKAQMQYYHDESKRYSESASMHEFNAGSASASASVYASRAQNSAAEIRNSYANAIKGNVSGEIVRVDDVSPLEHDVDVCVHGKNFANPNNILRALSVDLSYTEPELHIRKTNDIEKWSNIYIGLGDYKDFVGKTLSTSLDNMGDYAWSVLIVGTNNKGELIKEVGGASAKNGHTKFTVTVPKMIGAELLAIRIVSGDNLVTTGEEYILKNIQVEEGSVETDYEPYIDPSTVTVTRCCKNLLAYPYSDTTQTYNGITATDNGDGSITLNGTATNMTYFDFHRNDDAKPAYIAPGTYTFSFLQNKVNGVSVTFGLTDSSAGTANEYVYTANQIEIERGTTYYSFITIGTGTTLNNLRCWPMLELSDTKTDYELYSGSTINPASDGTCSITSVDPIMTIFTDTPGAIVDVTYNRDTAKTLESYIITEDTKNEIVDEILAEIGTGGTVNLDNYYSKNEINSMMGDLDSALDAIITIQNDLIDGDITINTSVENITLVDKSTELNYKMYVDNAKVKLEEV